MARHDPRAELDQDSSLWEMLLNIAYSLDRKMYGLLHCTRCCGARLAVKDGKLKLAPIIGSREVSLFPSRKEWERYRSEYLVPYKKRLAKVFGTANNKIEGR